MPTITSYLQQVQSWTIDPETFIQQTIQQIQKSDLNSFIRVHDQFISSHFDELASREFHSAPIGIKDNMMLTGEISSCASKMLEHYVAPYTATCCQKLIDKWFLPIWKTNMDEFAMGSSTEHSYFWPTINPHWINRMPWWSSGGSAAAVASWLCIAALWTDTGGSIRQPSSLCGIVGFKPTYGKISRYWVQSLSSSLDQVGTLTQTVHDAEILLSIMAGEDENDLQTLNPHTNTSSSHTFTAEKPKIAIPNEIFTFSLDPRVEALFRSKVDILISSWFQVDFIDFPLLRHVWSLYYILMSAELTSNLWRFDGMRFWCQKAGLDYTDIRSQAFWKEVKKRLMLWNYVVLHKNYDKYYKPALKSRQQLTNQFSKLFENYDAVMTPTTPAPASNLGSKTANSLQMYLEDLYTTPANLAWLPAISLPMWTVDENWEKLPVGIQLMWKQWWDEDLLHLAWKLESII